MTKEFEIQGKKLTFRYIDIDGKRKRYTCKALYKAEAKIEKAAFLAELANNKKHNGKYNINTLSWQQFCNLYIQYCLNHKSTTIDDQMVINTINKFFPNIKYLKDFDRTKVEEFRMLRRKQVSDSTVNRNMHCIKKMWTFAINDLEIDYKNQAKGIKDFPVALTQKIEYFTLEEIKKIKQTHIKDLQILFYLMLSFGLRLKEAVRIKWEDINFKTNRILIHPYKTFNRNPEPVSLTMPNSLIQFLKTLPKTNIFVIGKDLSTKQQLCNLSQRIKKHLKYLIGHGTAHIFRHTYITHAVNNPNIAERDILKTARITDRKILDAYGHYTKERETIIANEVYNENIDIEQIDKEIERLQKLKQKLLKNLQNGLKLD